MTAHTADSELGVWLDEQRQIAEEVGERLRKQVITIVAQSPAQGDPAIQELRTSPEVMVRHAASHEAATIVQQRPATPTRVYVPQVPYISTWIYALLLVALLLTGIFQVLSLEGSLPIWFALPGHLATDAAIVMWLLAVRSHVGSTTLPAGWSRYVLHVPYFLRSFSAQLQQVALHRQRVVRPPKALISIAVSITLTWLLWCALWAAWFGQRILNTPDEDVQLFVITHLALALVWGVVILLYARCLRLLK